MSVLYSIEEMENATEEWAVVSDTIRWLREFCGQPHPDLGRPGAVCPFVAGSIRLKALKIAVIHTTQPTPQEIAAVARAHMDSFFSLPPVDGPDTIYKSIVLIFPDITPAAAPTLIDGVQVRLKPDFVQAGLMIGEFHDGIARTSIHSQTLQPYRSPLPMLVIRSLLESDFPFLLRASDPLASRIRSLESYLAQRGPYLSAALKQDVVRALTQLRGQQRQGFVGADSGEDVPLAR